METKYIITGVIVSAGLVAVGIWYMENRKRLHFHTTRMTTSNGIVDNELHEVRHDDIALSPGFGVGEGTFGFGRFGSSFMA